MIENNIYAWDNIDKILSPDQIKSFLDSGLDMMKFSKEQYVKYLLSRTDSFHSIGLSAENAEHILDIGCGLGDDLVEIKELAGKKSLVTGIDISRLLVEEARKRIQHFAYDINVKVDDAHRLSFADNSFDITCSRRVFQHLKDPEIAFREMIRVTKPGGKILLIEPDRGSMLLDSKKIELTRIICRYIENVVRNPWIGRQLLSLFKENGLRDIQIRALSKLDSDYSVVDNNYGIQLAVKQLVSTNIIDAVEADEWLNDLKERNKKQTFFCSATSFVGIGYK